jgi:hypothetical protein
MVTNLARFGEISGKNLCNFYATPNELNCLPVLGCKQEEACVSKEEI